MNAPRTTNAGAAAPVARVSNGSETSGVPSTAPSEWRNLPQPSRDPDTSSYDGKGRGKEDDRNLPTAPPGPPQDEEA
jgi:hypothetical protein